MTRTVLLTAALILGGCHSGPMGAAGISLTGTVLTVVNQDWISGQLDFLHIGPAKRVVATPASQTTSAGAQ